MPRATLRYDLRAGLTGAESGIPAPPLSVGGEPGEFARPLADSPPEKGKLPNHRHELVVAAPHRITSPAAPLPRQPRDAEHPRGK